MRTLSQDRHVYRTPVSTVGRPPGRPLTDLEVRHLRLLLEIRLRAHSYAADYDEQLEGFVLECREQGASARGMADVLGVSPTTIQTWTASARRRRESSR
jgi:hypothetical protein